jgi:sugar lactone lactonase YvrE
MVRQVRPIRTPGWKALLAVTVAAAGLIWHVLACIESPMAFSPGGKHLAFVTVTPCVEKGLHLAGRCTYRLMVLSEGKKVRVIEQTAKHMLTAPGYSPDGRYLCYLRLPLLTPDQAEKLKKRLRERRKALADALEPKEDAAAGIFPKSPPGAVETKDQALPSAENFVEFYRKAAAGPTLPATLVVRDAVATDIVIATTKVQLPIFMQDNLGAGYQLAYLTTRPRYSPDGKWVYFCAGNLALAVDPKTGQRRFLAAPAFLATLAPDGKTLAFIQKETIGFLQTDGRRATYVRWDKDMTPNGFAWVDNKTLAVLTKIDKQPAIALLGSDGTVGRSIPLEAPGQADLPPGGMAVSPTGKHIVVSHGTGVRFLNAAGKVLGTWADENSYLDQPTFTPDGRKVAFKHLTKVGDGPPTTVGIAFFSPEGKELSHVRLPLIRPPGTAPAASRPTTTRVLSAQP